MISLWMQIWGQQNPKSRSLSDTSHCTRDIRKEGVAIDTIFCPPSKIQKYYFLSTGSWEHLEQRGATCSATGVPEVTFFAKMIKIPLVNPRFNQRSNLVRNLTKWYFFNIFTSNLSFLEIFSNFDWVWLKVDLGWVQNPNFDPAIGTSWNQCHYKYYWILIPTTTYGSKSELERPRYHKN